ncbi:MAG: glutaredoxin domain-containing protein [Nitrospirota bacterium]|nr:glutaredoxin domain-containing protein [Nitrospirota bacterium]
MEEFLSAQGVRYIAKNIMKDPAAREELTAKYGRMAAPTIVIGDKVILGFRQNITEIEKEIALIKRAQND